MSQEEEKAPRKMSSIASIKRDFEAVEDKIKTEDDKPQMPPSTLTGKRMRISQTPDEFLRKKLDPARQETRGAKLGQDAGKPKKSSDQYSTHKRTEQNRARIQNLSAEALEVKRAGERDRQARRRARMLIRASEEYKGLDNKDKEAYEEMKIRALEQVRDVKGISAGEKEFELWKEERKREEDARINAFAIFDETIKKRKATAAELGDDETDAVCPHKKAVWEPLIKSLERKVAQEGYDDLLRCLWVDTENVTAEATKQLADFFEEVEDPEGIKDPKVEYPRTYPEVFGRGELDEGDNPSLTIVQYAAEDLEANEVDEEQIFYLSDGDGDEDANLLVDGELIIDESESEESATESSVGSIIVDEVGDDYEDENEEDVGTGEDSDASDDGEEELDENEVSTQSE